MVRCANRAVPLTFGIFIFLSCCWRLVDNLSRVPIKYEAFAYLRIRTILYETETLKSNSYSNTVLAVYNKILYKATA